MTPERQRWWDSLPKEEKRVRRDIDDFKRAIKYHKKQLNDVIPYIAFRKRCIRYNKKAIKALRKEIAQRPVMRIQPPTASPYKCPRCGASLMYLLRCVKCGQKLRWK